MSKDLCVFCGARADTREHIIPQWMHRHYSIKHERIRLRNGTSIRYVHEVVPACKHCNTVRFSTIEMRIKAQTASPQELYVWASKIYWGLNLKDSFLPESRQNPLKGFVLTKDESIAGVEFLATILANFGKPGFTLYPYPFGSVFEINLPPEVETGFSLCSIGFPYNVITISLTETKLLTVVLNDKGLTQRAIKEGLLPNHGAVELAFTFLAKESEAVIDANTYAKLITLHYCRLKRRLIIPGGQSCSAKRVAAFRMPKTIRVTATDDASVMADVLGKLFEFEPNNTIEPTR